MNHEDALNHLAKIVTNMRDNHENQQHDADREHIETYHQGAAAACERIRQHIYRYHLVD